MKACRFDRALDEVWGASPRHQPVHRRNQAVEIAKTGDEDHLREVLAYQAGALVEIADLLEPFMPGAATRIRNVFSEGYHSPHRGHVVP